MDPWEQEVLQSANSELRRQVELLLDAYEQQRPRLTEVIRELEAIRVQVNSPDQSVQVTVDASGTLVDLTLTVSALRKAPEQLARAILDAAQVATHRAREQHAALTTATASELDAMPDLPDIMPEAPSLREIRAFFHSKENPPR